VPKVTVLNLLVKEVLNPFYIFQIFAVALWMYDNYRVYACCILFVSTVSVTVQMIENM
jgi:cation-transporting P-type ATPase 13A2